VGFDQLKTGAGILLLAPYVPLLFMGQEYAETAPFLYFVSHSDPGLVSAVREGRQKEFAAFSWKGEVPDAQHESTFTRSKLNHSLRLDGKHAVLHEWYRTLLRMRASHPALKTVNRQTTAVELAGDGHTILMRRWSGETELLAVFHLGQNPSTVEVEVREQQWLKLLDGADPSWLGDGSTVPELISAGNGRIQLELQPFQCLVIDSGGNGPRPTVVKRA
jgi:maltooligosyltrehalose trehalohydrolase